MGNHLLGMSWVVRTKSGQVDEEASSKKILGHLVSEMAISQLVRMRRQLNGGSMSECVVTLDSFPR
jgi:hypothetical protein